ncbi:MAG: SDR family oxidoreductase [Acidobacteriota bacterium]|nr:SDR family oxidoreductase [Acidobacteriota bacterium]
MILITGATGTVGSELVKQLAASGTRARALVRNRAKATSLEQTGFEVAEGDLAKPETLEAALQGVERVFLLSSPGPQMVTAEGNLVEAAKRAGVKHVVKLSAIGAAADSSLMLGWWHGQIEKQIEESGLAFTHLRPNSFMQNFLGFAPTIKAHDAFYAPMKDAQSSVVDARDIAAVAKAALTEAGHENQIYTITGPEALSYTEIAEKLSSVLGRKISYVDVPPEAAKKGMMDAGMPEWFAEALNELYAAWTEGYGAIVTDVVRDVAKKESITFDGFARDYAPAFKGGE